MKNARFWIFILIDAGTFPEGRGHKLRLFFRSVTRLRKLSYILFALLPSAATHAQVTYSGVYFINSTPITGGIEIGIGGTGSMSVSNGATIVEPSFRAGISNNGNGSITVDGAGSSLSVVINPAFLGEISLGEDYGVGSLTISNGGYVSCGGVLSIGNGGNGTVVVDGVGSDLIVSGYPINVGEFGGIGGPSTGNLIVSNGASVQAQGFGINVGTDPGSNGNITVDGKGSVIMNIGTLELGDPSGDNIGTVTLKNGGVLNDHLGSQALQNDIAYAEIWSGTLNIGGAANEPAAGPGILGYGRAGGVDANPEYPGPATIQFNTNATLSSPCYFTLDGTSTGQAVVIVGGQVVITSGVTFFTGNSTYSRGTFVNGGALWVNNPPPAYGTGSGTGSGPVIVANSGSIGGTGTIAGNVTVEAGGVFAPGYGVGTLNVLGNLVWNGSNKGLATALFTLGDTGSNSTQISITGSLTKGATGNTYSFNFQGTGQPGQIYTLATFASTNFNTSDFNYTGLASSLTGAFALIGGNRLIFIVGTTITTQPSSQTVNVGQNANFTVLAPGQSHRLPVEFQRDGDQWCECGQLCHQLSHFYQRWFVHGDSGICDRTGDEQRCNPCRPRYWSASRINPAAIPDHGRGINSGVGYYFERFGCS